MDAFVVINGREFRINPDEPIDISIPLDFGGRQPNAYDAEPAKAEPVVAGKMVGDTRRGGSCNFERLTLIPHCNGTHTECVGHITHERISVRDCVKEAFLPALLVTVEPENAVASGESYTAPVSETDEFITRASLERSMGVIDAGQPEALIVRTLPNDDSKASRIYDTRMPPFFSTEAMEFLVRQGIRCLLVDLPSIDRMYDEGKLSNHRTFWNVEPGSFQVTAESRVNATVTELIYVRNSVPDGEYLLNLQIAPFVSDASPSRPLLFRPNLPEVTA